MPHEHHQTNQSHQRQAINFPIWSKPKGLFPKYHHGHLKRETTRRSAVKYFSLSIVFRRLLGLRLCVVTARSRKVFPSDQVGQSISFQSKYLFDVSSHKIKKSNVKVSLITDKPFNSSLAFVLYQKPHFPIQ